MLHAHRSGAWAGRYSRTRLQAQAHGAVAAAPAGNAPGSCGAARYRQTAHERIALRVLSPSLSAAAAGGQRVLDLGVHRHIHRHRLRNRTSDSPTGRRGRGRCQAKIPIVLSRWQTHWRRRRARPVAGLRIKLLMRLCPSRQDDRPRCLLGRQQAMLRRSCQQCRPWRRAACNCPAASPVLVVGISIGRLLTGRLGY